MLLARHFVGCQQAYKLQVQMTPPNRITRGVSKEALRSGPPSGTDSNVRMIPRNLELFPRKCLAWSFIRPKIFAASNPNPPPNLNHEKPLRVVLRPKPSQASQNRELFLVIARINPQLRFAF